MAAHEDFYNKFKKKKKITALVAEAKIPKATPAKNVLSADQ